jgi:hypothetical protein
MAVGLAELLATLDERLGSGSYAIVGAVARNAWAPPRATTDLDVAIAAEPAAVAAAEGSLRELGYAPVRRHQVESDDALPDLIVFRSARSLPRQVDLLVAKTDFEAAVLARAVAVQVSGHRVLVASPEDLVVYKLLADRPRDREDAEAVILTQERAGRALDWSHVERWARYWEIEDRARALRERVRLRG